VPGDEGRAALGQLRERSEQRYRRYRSPKMKGCTRIFRSGKILNNNVSYLLFEINEGLLVR
jgi:hypothetical protein